MDEEELKKAPDKKDAGETVRISLEADPVEVKRICEACYWKGRSDATFTFLLTCLIIMCATLLMRKFLNVTE